MATHFPREMLLELRKMDEAKFQSFANYAGSRVLAAATAFLLKMAMMEDEERDAFKLALCTEIVSQFHLQFACKVPA